MQSSTIIIDTRTYRFLPRTTGELTDFYPAPASIAVRLTHDDGGYRLSVRMAGDARFSPWPGTRGKRIYGERPSAIFEKVESHSMIGERIYAIRQAAEAAIAKAEGA